MKYRILFIAALLLSSNLASAQLAIVVHPQSPLATVDSRSLSKVFLGKTNEIHNTPVTPVDQADGRAPRDTFYSKVANKDPSQMQTYWAREIFAGNNQPPETVADDAAVKAWINQTPDGIGYIDASTVDATVKVIYTLD